MAIPKPNMQQIINRFWSKVNKNGPIHPVLKNKCWIWTGSKIKNGYGVFSLNGKNITAHRFCYQIHNDTILSPKELVCHHCDTRDCVNPEHLFKGNHKDNCHDMIQKNRQNRYNRNGEKNPFSKLKETDVLEIRKMIEQGHKQKEIASTFNVSIHLIRKISYRQVWNHI